MKKDEASKLLTRFLSAQKEGKEPYFDADEIDRLLDSFEESDDWNHYEEVLCLGRRLHPGHLDLKLRECKLSIFRQDYFRALELLDELTEINNQDIDALRLECYCNLNKYKKVEHCLQQSLDQQCDYAESLFEHAAGILNDLDETKEARHIIEWGLKLYPANLILKDELCYIMEAEGEFPQAIQLCNELIDKDPFSYDTWFTLGRLYSMTGDFEKAIEAFDYALTCDESDLELRILRSYCLFMNESYEEAINAYSEISSNDDIRERIKPLIAECYIKLERYEECYELLRSVVYSGDDDIETACYINFMRCCMEIGREEECMEVLEQALEACPTDIRLLSLVALAYIEDGETEMAMQIAKKILELIDLNEEPLKSNQKGFFKNSLNIYFRGNLMKACRYYKKVFDFDHLPQDMPFINIQRALAYFNMGDMELFSKHYRRAGKTELAEYIRMAGLEDDDRVYEADQIPPDKLSYEYLLNKDNNN